MRKASARGAGPASRYSKAMFSGLTKTREVSSGADRPGRPGTDGTLAAEKSDGIGATSGVRKSAGPRQPTGAKSLSHRQRGGQRGG